MKLETGVLTTYRPIKLETLVLTFNFSLGFISIGQLLVTQKLSRAFSPSELLNIIEIFKQICTKHLNEIFGNFLINSVTEGNEKAKAKATYVSKEICVAFFHFH